MPTLKCNVMPHNDTEQVFQSTYKHLLLLLPEKYKYNIEVYYMTYIPILLMMNKNPLK